MFGRKGSIRLSKILIIGTIAPSCIQEFCFSKGVRTSAADIAQQYMLHGLEHIAEVDSVDVIGAVRIKPWPKIAIPFLKSCEEKTRKGIMYSVGYLNLPIVGFFLREHNIVTRAKKWAMKHRMDDVIVLIYSMHSPFLKAAKTIKRIIPNAKVVVTVADLPLFMDMRGNLRIILKRMDWYRIKKLMRSANKYLLYTKYMADYLKLSEGQWMVFEGLIDEKRVVTKKQKKYPEKVCLYAGNLDARYGIDILIEAFKKIQCDAILHIYGAGFDAERIKKIVENIKNVEYMGQVTQDEIFSIMKKATLLINPRPSSIGLAKYSCPSKTFEYMASGTPALMNRLPGIPDEYAPYLLFFNEETAEGYAKRIDELFSKNPQYLENIGLNAASFLKNNKSSSIVMGKVYDFMEK